MRKFTKEENDGRVALNLFLRNSVAPELGKMLPSQNAELIRILAECFETSNRYAQLWTTLGGQRRPFIVSSAPEDIIEQKIILALAMTTANIGPKSRRSFYVKTKGSTRNQESPTLKTLLRGPYYEGQLFNWEFSSYAWGNEFGSPDTEALDFYLKWEYQTYTVPDWVPPEIRPNIDGDSSPF